MTTNKKIKILVVEDEAIIAMRLEMELKELGYDVCVPVSNGEDAIKSVKTENPDIVLMDLHLVGNLQGIDVSREIHKKYKIPLIFMTGYQDDDMMKEAMKLEPVCYLIKPIEMSMIKTAINSVFDR